MKMNEQRKSDNLGMEKEIDDTKTEELSWRNLSYKEKIAVSATVSILYIINAGIAGAILYDISKKL